MGVRSSLLSSMITNAVNMVATFVAIYVVDRCGPLSTLTNAMLPANHGTTAQRLCKAACTDEVPLKLACVHVSCSVSHSVSWHCRQGRKPLFVVCGSIMSAMQIATGILTAVTFTGVKIPTTAGIIMIVFICIFVSQFAASWGPLGWLVPSEMHPLQTRTAGQVRSPSQPSICAPDALLCIDLSSAMDFLATLLGFQHPASAAYDHETADGLTLLCRELMYFSISWRRS